MNEIELGNENLMAEEVVRRLRKAGGVDTKSHVRTPEEIVEMESKMCRL
jgi:hypothetical protein